MRKVTPTEAPIQPDDEPDRNMPGKLRFLATALEDSWPHNDNR